jgi:CheY-like chemotaxis protein
MTAPPGPPGPPPAAPAAPDPEARVLVIDDERDVGIAIARLLKPIPVVFAQSAAGALGRLEAGGKFGAVVCDIRMPGIDGMQFYQAVVERDPKLARRIVYVTGSLGSPALTEFLSRTGCACLRKPFEGRELRAAVARAMAGTE